MAIYTCSYRLQGDGKAGLLRVISPVEKDLSFLEQRLRCRRPARCRLASSRLPAVRHSSLASGISDGSWGVRSTGVSRFGSDSPGSSQPLSTSNIRMAMMIYSWARGMPVTYACMLHCLATDIIVVYIVYGLTSSVNTESHHLRSIPNVQILSHLYRPIPT